MIYDSNYDLLLVRGGVKLPKDFDHEIFKKKCKKLLKERKLTYYDVCDGTGYKYQSIAQYFQGKRPSRFVALALASYLNISLMEGVKKNEKEGKR